MTPCSVCRLPEHKDTPCVDALKSVLAALAKNIGMEAHQLMDESPAGYRRAIRNVLQGLGVPALCRGCRQSVTWVKHANGKNAPYDPTGINHFITCKKAKEFKRK